MTELPRALIERLEHYFLTYKMVPGRRTQASIEKVYGRRRVVQAALADYQEKFE